MGKVDEREVEAKEMCLNATICTFLPFLSISVLNSILFV